MSKRRKRRKPAEIAGKLRDADAMLGTGQDQAAVPPAPGVSEATPSRSQEPLGGRESPEARRLRELEEENRRLRMLMAEQALDITMLRSVTSKDW